MPRCPLCESEVPEGWPACGACDQPLDRPLTTLSTAAAVGRALEIARKALAAEAGSRADLAFARALVERSEQTEAAGDYGRALDLARASRRAMDVAKRRARVDGALSRADTVLKEAKEAGIETLAFERNLLKARDRVAHGDYAGAERLLRRTSVRTLDQRREKQLLALLDKAAARIRYSKERGASIPEAEDLLVSAREALALREYSKIRPFAAKAIEKAETARRYARSEAILSRVALDVDQARKDGANVTEARKVLTGARDALRRGLYVEVQRLSLRGRAALRESRRYAAAESVFREAEREASREARRGADVSRAEGILEAARKALDLKEYSKVRTLAKEAHDAVREAALLKHVQDALASLRLDAEDLRNLGADGSEFGSILQELQAAIGAKDLPGARRLVDRARHAAEATREAHYRAVKERTLATILANAARGVDPELAKEVLRKVEDAMSLGQSVDVQALLDARLSAVDAETSARLNERILKNRDLVVELRKAGQTTTAIEGKLADAAIAVSEGRHLQADALLDAAEHDIYAAREDLRGEAAEILGRAREHVAHTKTNGIPVGDALRGLHDAEVAFSEGRYADVITQARDCIANVDRAAEEVEQRRRTTEAAKVAERRSRIETIQKRIESVRSEIENLVRDHVDLSTALDALNAAASAITADELDEAERQVAAAEGIVQGVRTTLNQKAREAADRLHARMEEARTEGLLTPEMEKLFADAEAALQAGRPGRSLELAENLERLLETRRRERALEEQRRLVEEQKLALGKARDAAAKFITVKKLIEDLRKADIDIAGAAQALEMGERALREKDFEKVDQVLADLDVTAKELMEELIAAAKSLANRAETRIRDAREKGLSVEDALASLNKAEAYFERGDYDDAVEYAKAAERQVLDALEAHEEAEAAKDREASDAAGSRIAAIKRIISDLGRADISIVNADKALARAQAAFDEGRHADVARELAETEEVAQSLTIGLEAAAKDLVAVAAKEVLDSKEQGIGASRAEMVLANAHQAIEDRRFVEAIEYKKVIEDILEDSRKELATLSVRDTLSELRARAGAHAKLGADVRLAAEMLTKAEARVSKGETRDIDIYIGQIRDSIEVSRRAHLGGLVESLGPLAAEGISLGLDREELEELRTHAQEAAEADDLEEVYRIKGDLQERILDVKRRAILRKANEEIQSLEDVFAQSERLGIPVQPARVHLDGARQAIEAGDVEGFQRGLERARGALDETRAKHFAERYESRVHAVSTMIGNAKRLGAEVGEAEASLGAAEAALRTSDMAMADILVKQAEVAIGIQIQNFIKNRYPNLLLHLPTIGMQANVWNRYVFEVENKGKLPARNVEIEFQGDLESKGMAPIPELGVDERREVEIGLKPKAAGNVPVEVGVSYQRMFDENRYELRDTKEIKVEPEGTYLVEDVFLIHSDGRLISHQSRKFREAIDEDIFSGMLTVVQDFIKDSFKRARTPLKRLEFGDNKILIERSPHTFLATVLVGQEPKLLPFYMVEVLREIEEKYGAVLERWTGMLHQLEGVDEIIARLVFVAKDTKAEMGTLADSPVTVTAKVIEALGVQEASEVNALLQEAQSTLESDILLSWEFIEKARAQAETTREELNGRMADLLLAARDTVEEMKAIGADTGQAELLLREGEEALQEGKFDRVREIHQNLHESLERSKGELAAKKVEVELASLINEIQIARSQNLDVREAESYLTKIENAIQKRNYRQMEDFLRRAKESLGRQRRKTVLDKAREDLSRLQSTLAEARAQNLDLGDVEVLIAKAEEALRAENLRDLETVLDRAEATAKARIADVLKERYPRLFMETAHSGLQANRWNRFGLTITNKGNWPARDLNPTVLGPVDVQGLHPVKSLAPNEKVSLDLGVRPREAGTMDLDFEIHYSRPLDDAKYQATDSAQVRVEQEGGYTVEDAILLHDRGAVVCHETRAYRPPEETAQTAALEAEAKALVEKAFTQGGGKGLQRAQMGDKGLIGSRGPHVFLVLGLRGTEPPSLPLYMIQSLKEIHDAYGIRLEEWTGDSSTLAGIGDLVRKLLFATDAPGVSLGPLEDSPVSKIPLLVQKGVLGSPDGQDFLSWARGVLDRADYPEGFKLLDQVKEATAGPSEEISRQIQQAVLASKESGGLQLSDEQVTAYVEVLRRALEAAFLAKRRAGIERYWPVARIAIKPSDPLGFDAISAFRKIIVGQSGAKELDIVSPSETWRGMKIEIQVHMDSVSAAYRLWAKKIEILLRSQDSWKIKAGLEKGEYSVGIEGQKVRIDPTMVSFIESVPEHVVEEPFDGGVVYLDTRMTKDLLSEGYAKEVVNIVRETRKEMRLSDESVVQVDLVASGKLREMLKPWIDLILREANALDVRFMSQAPGDAYVVEATLGDETFYVALSQAQM